MTAPLLHFHSYEAADIDITVDFFFLIIIFKMF